MNRPISTAAMLALGACFPVLSGCGLSATIAVGIAALSSDGGGGGGTIGNGTATVSVEGPAGGRAPGNTAEVFFTVADPEGDEVDLEVEVAVAGAAQAPLSVSGTTAAQEGLVFRPLIILDTNGNGTLEAPNRIRGIPTPTSGQSRLSFDWDLAAQFGSNPPAISGVRIRMFRVGTDPEETAALTPAELNIIVGNDAPVAGFVSATTDPAGQLVVVQPGRVSAAFALADSTSDRTSVTVRLLNAFRDRDNDFIADDPDLNGDGTPDILLTDADLLRGSTQGLITAPAPASRRYEIVVDTVRLFGIRNVVGLNIEIIPDDGKAGDAKQALAPGRGFDIVNDTPPRVQILSVGGATGDPPQGVLIPVRFVVFDEEALLDPTGPSGAPGVAINVSVGGGFSLAATGIVRRDAGRDQGLASLDALPANPSASGIVDGLNTYTFLWDASADGFGGVGRQDVELTIFPFLNFAGGSDTAAFALGEEAAPFGPEMRLATDAEPRRVLLADVNADGRLDLATVEGAFLVRRGNGDGTFANPRAVDAAMPPASCGAFADVTGDGVLDAVVGFDGAGVGTGYLNVYAGDGAGLFTLGQSLAFPAGGPLDIALGDVTGDGVGDLVAGLADGTIAGLRGDGTGGFADDLGTDGMGGTAPLRLSDALPFSPDPPAPLTIRVLLVQLDGQGPLDLASLTRKPGPGGVSNVVIRLAAAPAQPPVPPFADPFDPSTQLAPVSDGTADVVLADINSDGRLDLLAIAEREISFISAGSGRPLNSARNPIARAGIPLAVAVGPIDGDGFLDLVVGYGTGEVGVQLGREPNEPIGPSTQPPELGFEGRFPAGTSVSSVALGDLNGDGALDLVLANATLFGSPPSGATSNLAVRLGTGGAGFGKEPVVSLSPVISSASRIVVEDVSEDGQRDVVASVPLLQGQGVYVLKRRPGGGFEPPEQPALPADSPRGLALGDRTGDGRLDLAVAQGTAVKFFDGPGPFSPFSFVPGSIGDVSVGGTPVDVAFADLDGDAGAALDLAAAVSGAAGSDSIQVFFGAGSGAFGNRIVLPIATGMRDVAVGDLDLDGNLDVVGLTSGADGLRLYYGQRTDTDMDLVPDLFLDPAANVAAPLADGDAAVLADLDGDGRLDVVGTRNAAGGSVFLRQGWGGGGPLSAEPGLAPTIDAAAGTDAVGVVVADLDGDGRLDVATVSPGDRTATVLLARPRSAFAGVRRGGAARGDGEESSLRFLQRRVPLDSLPAGLAAGDVNGDGVADLAVAGSSGGQMLISAATAGSVADLGIRPFDPFQGAPDPNFDPFPTVPEVRRLPVPPLDLGLTSSPVAPVGAAPGTVRFAHASGAVAFLPETAVAVPSRTARITLRLKSSFTADELSDVPGKGLVFRIFRDEPQLIDPANRAQQIDRRFGSRKHSTLVEVARRVPGVTGGGGLPDATVDPVAGTIAFDVTRLGRYQAFAELSNLTATFLRETFDAAGTDSAGASPLPGGWVGSEIWQGGVPTRPAGSPTAVPAPASAPSLLVLGRERDIVGVAGGSVLSRPFVVGLDATGRVPTLRLKVGYDLTDAQVEIALVFAGGGRQVVKTYPAGTSPLGDDTIPCAAAFVAAGLVPGASDTARLELRLVPDGSPMASPRAAFFADDVDLGLEPAGP